MIEKWSQLKFEELGKEARELDPEEAPEEGQSSIPAWEARLRSETAKTALESRTPSAGGADERGYLSWFEDYTRLRGHGWPWRVAVYVAWAATPKERRAPRTQEELATGVLGLTSDRVIYQWRRKNPGIEDAIAVLQSGAFFEHRAGVIEALIESAKNPNYKGHQDRKLFFEMVGDYTPRSEQNVKLSGDVGDLSELSEAELARMAGTVRPEGGEMNRQDAKAGRDHPDAKEEILKHEKTGEEEW